MQHQCCKHKTDLTGEMLALENKKKLWLATINNDNTKICTFHDDKQMEQLLMHCFSVHSSLILTMCTT